MVINIIFIISLAAVAGIGFVLGLGKALKLSTKGILGIIISIFVCFMFGGIVKSFGAVVSFIESADLYFAGLWGFWGKLPIGTAIYYICFFAAVQIVRILIVKIICKIDSIGNDGRKLVSKALGAVYAAVFCFALFLLILAGLKFFENSDFAIKILAKIQDSFLWTLYINNPIVL